MIKQSSSNNNRNTFTQNKKNTQNATYLLYKYSHNEELLCPPLATLSESSIMKKNSLQTSHHPKNWWLEYAWVFAWLFLRKYPFSLSFSLIRYTLVITTDWLGLLLEEEEKVCLKTWRHNCKATKSYKATTTRTTRKQPSTTVTGKTIRKMYLLERERKRDALTCCFLFSWMFFSLLCIPTSINLSVHPSSL